MTLFKKHFVTTLLFLVFLLGFLLRIIGTFPGYPPNHPDEPIIAISLDMIMNLQLDPFQIGGYRFQYPAFLPYLYAFIYLTFFIPITVFLGLLSNPFALLQNLDRPFIFMQTLIIGDKGLHGLFWARYITAFLGFLTVPLIFLVGKKLFNQYVGLIAALFLAVNYRHVMSSHLSLPDAPNSFFALLVLFICLKMFESPTRKNYFLAATSVGISLATKLYLFSMLPFITSHLLVSFKKKTYRAITASLFRPSFFLSLAIIVFVFFVFNPFLPFHFAKAFEQHSINNLRYGMGSYSFVWQPVWYLWEIGFGRVFSILFILGLVMAVVQRKYRISALYLLLFIAPPAWVLLYYSHGGVYTRNFTSVIPFAVLFSSLAFVTCIRFVWVRLDLIRKLLPLALFIGGVLVSIPQLSHTTIMSYGMAKPWNRNCIENWMNIHLKKGDKVTRSSLVPLVKDNEIAYFPYSNTYAHRTPFSLVELQIAGIDYLIVDYGSVAGNFYGLAGFGRRYWHFPVEELDMSFDSLALKELSRHTIFSCFKPWQALDDNYTVIKIPKRSPTGILQLLQKFNKETVVRELGSPLPVSKRTMISGLIPIKEGKKYIVRGVIHSDKALPKEHKDGFLRVDFYERKDSYSINTRGVKTTISSRFFGEAGSMEKEVAALAPKGALFMTISFQVEDYKANFSLRDVSLYVAEQKPTDEEMRAANTREVDNFIIYPLAIF